MASPKHPRFFYVLGLIAAACGPSPKPKQPDLSIKTDGPQAESIEWLYATPGSSGVVKDECKLVVPVLEGEQKCSGDLCQHAINLGEDWLNTCHGFEPSQVPKVQQLVDTFKSRVKVSGGECAYEGMQLIDKGCPSAADCAVTAQKWATKCSKHASPLVVSMIEKQVERSTQTPIELDTTSCEEMFAKLTASTGCGNDFECEEKLGALKQYQLRCVDPNAPQPLDHAVKQALLVQAASKEPPSPIPVKEAKFAPQKGRLLLDDKSGFVVAVGDQPAPNVRLLVKTLHDSQYVLPVRLARIFSDESNRHELRLGSIDVPDAETFFRRYASLKLQGQDEALKSYAANRAISKLNEVVKVLDQQQAALKGLIAAMSAARDVQDDPEFRTEVAKADKHLARVFERLAAAKRSKLPRANVRGERMRDRVAYARRSWQQPFADVNAEGRVELGATSPAVLVDTAALFPISFAAYRQGMDGTIGKALRTLEEAHESTLIGQAQKLADACTEKRTTAAQLEDKLLACAFGVMSCANAEAQKTGKELDQAVSAHEAAQADLQMALLELENPPKGKLAQAVDSCNH